MLLLSACYRDMKLLKDYSAQLLLRYRIHVGNVEAFTLLMRGEEVSNVKVFT